MSSQERHDQRAREESPEPSASWGTLLGRRYGAVTVVLAGGVAAHAINVYLVAAMLPSVVAEIGGLRLYAWNTTLFVFASVVASIVVPRVLAVAGPRGAYRWGLGLFVAGSTVCAGAFDISVLLLGRTLQGAGGGLLFGLAYALIRARLPEPLWSRGNALVSAMWGIGTLVGPALGGAFAQIDQWRIAFLVLLVLPVVLSVLVTRAIPARRPGAPIPVIPVANLVLLGAAVVVLSATSLAEEPAVNLPGVAVAVVMVAVVVLRERRTAPRILPHRSFAPGSALRWLSLTIVLLIVGSTAETFVPLFGQRLADLSPLAAGFLGAAIAAGWTIGSTLSAATRHVRLILVVAPTISAVGLAGLAATTATDTGTGRVLVWAALLLGTGIGIGIAWPHLTTAAMRSACTEDEQDAAAASITTVQLVATALGSALGGTLVNLAGLSDRPPNTQASAITLYSVFATLVLAAVPAATKTRELVKVSST